MTCLVGSLAPDFTAPAIFKNGTIDSFNLNSNIKDRMCLIFFYPLDFTFVCPSELIALNKRLDEFTDRNIKVITISIDSQFVHNAWQNTPIDQGGIGKVNFTMIADINQNIIESYNVKHPVQSVALRAAFIIDKNSIVRAQIINDLPIGRNIEEIIRIFDAIRFIEENGEVCPVNWQKGAPGMQPTQQGVATYLNRHKDDL